jgi:hypothetical protein
VSCVYIWPWKTWDDLLSTDSSSASTLQKNQFALWCCKGRSLSQKTTPTIATVDDPSCEFGIRKKCSNVFEHINHRSFY